MLHSAGQPTAFPLKWLISFVFNLRAGCQHGYHGERSKRSEAIARKPWQLRGARTAVKRQVAGGTAEGDKRLAEDGGTAQVTASASSRA